MIAIGTVPPICVYQFTALLAGFFKPFLTVRAKIIAFLYFIATIKAS
jgi:hypothetical protein